MIVPGFLVSVRHWVALEERHLLVELRLILCECLFFVLKNLISFQGVLASFFDGSLNPLIEVNYRLGLVWLQMLSLWHHYLTEILILLL